MRIAKLHMDPKDKLAFEIHGKSSVKYNLKANHQVEAKRWYWALNNAIQWAKDEAKEDQRRQQQESAALKEARNEQLERYKNRETDVAQTGKGMLVPGASLDVASFGASPSLAGSTIGEQMSGYERSVKDNDSIKMLTRTNTANIEGDIDDDEEYGDDASSHELKPTNKDAFSITAQSAKLQLDLLEQVSAAMQSEKNKNPDMTISHPTVVQALASYDMAVGNLKGLLMDLLRISKDHEAYWQYRLDREQNIRRLWEDSMARVAQEQEVLENRIGESEDKRKRTKRALKEALEGNMPEIREPLAEEQAREDGKPTLSLPNDAMMARRGSSRRPTIAQLTNNEVSDDDSEVDEEFFDAVDAGEVEVVDEMPPMSTPAVERSEPTMSIAGGDEIESEEQDERLTEISKSYRGYEDGIRKRLKLDADNRPKVSLWVRHSRHMIGLYQQLTSHRVFSSQ